MSREYDNLYFQMVNTFNVLKKIGFYRIPGLKGILYKHFSHKASKKTVDEVANDVEYNGNGLIVSLTTFGKRTDTVYKTILSIINQNLRPERIILWLDRDEYCDDTLPSSLVSLRKSVTYFDICYCDNIRPHKKYYYTMMKYPDNIVVTADDDVYYPSNWLNELYQCYLSHPDCVCCTNAHRLKVLEDYSIGSYDSWDFLVSDIGPDITLCPIGVGGVLFPPHVLNKDVFDKKFIIDNCLNADDLWLKTMALIDGVKVVHVDMFSYTFLTIQNTQRNALSKGNVKNNKNDEQLSNIMKKYGEKVKEVLCEELSR